MKVAVVEATPEHGQQLLRESIRVADRAEWVFGAGGVPLPVLFDRLFAHPADQITRRAFVCPEEGRTLALWGATANPLMGNAAVWLIASEAAVPLAPMLHLYARREMAMLHEHYGPELDAYVYERNEMHVRWLGLLGFRRIRDVADTMWTLWVREEPNTR